MTITSVFSFWMRAISKTPYDLTYNIWSKLNLTFNSVISPLTCFSFMIQMFCLQFSCSLKKFTQTSWVKSIFLFSCWADKISASVSVFWNFFLLLHFYPFSNFHLLYIKYFFLQVYWWRLPSLSVYFSSLIFKTSFTLHL